MKLYLSSYKLGSTDNVDKLKTMIKNTNKELAYISNALDFSTDLDRRNKSEQSDIDDLSSLGLKPTKLDLRDYFGKKEELKKYLEKFDVIRVRGGNTFVLRQAMSLSGFDEILKDWVKQKKDKIYGGYSAGVCVLGPSLKNLQIVDDPTQKPYGDIDVIWEGLSILDYTVFPHYRSDHFESEDIEKEVQLAIDQKILFKTLRDGEVIVID